MNDIESFNFTEEDFNRIWAERSKQKKTWSGSDPKPCFDYHTDDHTENYFKQNNWNDTALQDFREILFDLDIDEVRYIGNARIQRLVIDGDESRYIIRNNFDVYVLSQYKSRGNVQSFVSSGIW